MPRKTVKELEENLNVARGLNTHYENRINEYDKRNKTQAETISKLDGTITKLEGEVRWLKSMIQHTLELARKHA